MSRGPQYWRPSGIGAIDAGVTGALVLYGGKTSDSTGAVIISHALALLLPILAGSGFALLPGEINRQRQATEPATFEHATSS